MNEFELIERYIKPLVTHQGAAELKDDAAVLDVPEGYELVITTDTLIENVHFFPHDPVKFIAKKALRVNISDLMAKGAKPYAFTLNLGMPKPFNESFCKAFFKGLGEDCRKYEIALIGGDTTASPVLMITITAFGLVKKGKIIRRFGAKSGDYICVTGKIGYAALGLEARRNNHWNCFARHFVLPQPSTKHLALISSKATSSMDISDGLIGDCEKLLKASDLGGILRIKDIPLAASLLSLQILTALTGGDDYQTLFTVSKENFTLYFNSLSDIFHIGEVTGENHLKVYDEDFNEVIFQKKSFSH